MESILPIYKQVFQADLEAFIGAFMGTTLKPMGLRRTHEDLPR